MTRLSLLWLLAGVSVGSVMMMDGWIPGRWRVWMTPTHGHMLFVGWFVQFALGIGLWLLPRTRSVANPLGYRESTITTAIVALNAGLAVRVILEPIQRSGNRAGWLDFGLAASAVLQLLAVGIFVVELWPRLKPRLPRPAVS